MTPLHTGDVVLVSFPFTDLSSTKLRPAVIVSTETVHDCEEDYTLLFISSVTPDKIENYELVFEKTHPDYKLSGLKKKSVFKANKIVTLQKNLLKRKMGKLGPQIRKELQNTLNQAIALI